MLIGLVIMICGSGYLWYGMVTSPEHQTRQSLKYHEDNPLSIKLAFATAMRVNDDIAYEVSDPDLWSRIDEWMATHEVRLCSKQSMGFVGGTGSDSKTDLSFYCPVAGPKPYDFHIEGIVLDETTNLIVAWDWITEEP